MTEFDFGPLLRVHRQAARLTLEELAAASGVSARAISDMERGRSRGPQRRTVVALADALRLAPDEHAAVLAAAKIGRVRATAGSPPLGLCELPRSVPDFTGREGELDGISALAEGGAAAGAATVALVSGPAGLGKTSFAVHAGHLLAGGFPDGAFFVDLRGMDAEPLPSAVALGRLARALGTPAPALPSDSEERAGLYRSLLRDKRALIVLDNAADEAQVRPLLPNGGRSLTLVTSRRLLAGLEGVQRLEFGSLSEAEAAGLLHAILGPDGAADDAAMAEVARLCGCLPLALRIAGNRLLSRPGWTAGDLAARLRKAERRLDQLVAGDLRVAAAFGLSYDQLPGPARLAFRRLALVPGLDFAAPLVAALCATTPDEAEDTVDELAELALLEPAPGGRHRLHDLVRLFAGERLAEEEPPADRAAAAVRMEDWLLDGAVVAGRWHDPDAVPPSVDAAVGVPMASTKEATAWLRVEGDNWLAALRSAAAADRPARVVEVGEAMHWISDSWADWDRWTEVFTLSSAAAAALGDQGEEARQLNYLSWARLYRRDHETALELADRALALAESAGNLSQQAWAHYYACQAYTRLGSGLMAGDRARAAERLFAAVGDTVAQVLTLVQIADGERTLGRHAASIEQLQQVLVLLDDPASGVPPHIAGGQRAHIMARIGVSYEAIGDLTEAVHWLGEALPRMEMPGIQARLEEQLAKVLLMMGDRDAAVAAYGRAADLHTELGAAQEADRLRAAAALSTAAAVDQVSPEPNQ